MKYERNDHTLPTITASQPVSGECYIICSTALIDDDVIAHVSDDDVINYEGLSPTGVMSSSPKMVRILHFC